LSPQQEIQKIAEKMPQTNALHSIIKQFGTINLILDMNKSLNLVRLLGPACPGNMLSFKACKPVQDEKK
jgi:hypothetical protein